MKLLPSFVFLVHSVWLINVQQLINHYIRGKQGQQHGQKTEDTRASSTYPANLKHGRNFKRIAFQAAKQTYSSSSNMTSETHHLCYVILFNRMLWFFRGILSRGVINCGIVIPPETIISATLEPSNILEHNQVYCFLF